MRIDATTSKAARGADDAGKTAASRPQSAALPLDQGLEVTSSQQRLIDAARQAPAVRAEMVAEATKLLQAGQLDTPEAAMRAAAAILDRGL